MLVLLILKQCYHASATKMILDEQLLSDLKVQLATYNDDKALALKIVPTIDYTKNLSFIMEICSRLW